MATYSRAVNALVTCPYDPCHRLLSSRLQMHIAKCKLNHPEKNLVACYYNAGHYVEEAELQYHLTNCPDRLPMEKAYSKAMDANNPFKNSTEKEYCPPVVHCSEESWDNEMGAIPRAGYIPQQKINPNGFVPDLGMMKPAERKKVYKSLHSLADTNTNVAETKVQAASPALPITKTRQPKEKLSDLQSNMNLPKYGLERSDLCGIKADTRIAANIFSNVGEISASNNIAPIPPPSYSSRLSQHHPTNNSVLDATHYTEHFPALGLGRGSR